MPISLVCVHEIPLSPSAIYKRIAEGSFPRPIQLKGRSWWPKDEVDAWFYPQATVDLILEHKKLLTGGFTEAELRSKGWKGLINRGYNQQAL